jgi:alpha-N-arabinofuranosidase
MTPTFQCALSDAAFLTGLQRNADIVIMSCYAPLFTRVDPAGNQWRTNLIGYNSLMSYGSPAYYVQKMFDNARGDRVLPIESITPQTIPTLPAAPEPPPPTTATSRPGRFRPPPPPNPNEPLFACASKEDAGDIILKVVNVFDTDQTLTVELSGATVLKSATAQVITGQPDDTNSIDAPNHIIPKEVAIDDASSSWNHAFPGNSVSVIRFRTK